MSGMTKEANLLLPYSEAGIIDLLKREAQILSMDYEEAGIRVAAVLSDALFGRLQPYMPDYQEEPEDWEQ